MIRWPTAVLSVLFVALLPTSAHAAGCDAMVKKVGKVPSADLSGVYGELIECDKALATESFNTFMRASEDTGVLVDLSLKAISFEIYEPVWDMLEQIADYQARTEVADRVGALCRDNVGVLPFLKGGYYAMNDRAFKMWSQAFVTCPSDELDEWLQSEIASPPNRTYDDKYDSLLGAIVKRKGPGALGPLQKAAIAASERGGPFTNVLEKMQEAAQPGGMGAKMSDEAKKELVASLVRVGERVRPEQAALVADRLYASGQKTEAAGLLKTVYGDRVQPDGRLLYGVTATEHCGGEALIHVVSVFEPSKRWSIQDDVTGPARAFKKRLKCDTDGDWPVQITTSPVASEADVDAFVATIVQKWSDKNLVVKIRKEKPIELP
ncbi:MAG: hypothetical protein H6737_20925 [Alphaproteobacteria bacterium]|nr:hypothetical protein [Alphaproteobacteria bacterium]